MSHDIFNFRKDIIVELSVTFTFWHDADIFSDIQPGEFI